MHIIEWARRVGWCNIDTREGWARAANEAKAAAEKTRGSWLGKEKD